MEKINVAELLKDCPKGMELDCTMFVNPVTLNNVVDDDEFPITIETAKGCFVTLTKYGTYAEIEEAKCVIYPKGKTTWEGFIPPCKFKVGDRIKNKNTGICDKVIKVFKDCYLVTNCLDEQATIGFDIQDNWELVPNKFDISTLKPFDKVLTRANNDDSWVCNLYSHRIKDYYVVLNAELAPQCIPYEGNEHLLGTTDDCDNFYKVWL